MQPESRGCRQALGQLLFPGWGQRHSQGFTSKEEEAECCAAGREKSWVVPEECLSPSLPLPPPALELELELLPAEPVQGARWCQARGVTA